ncbi:MAG: ribonuclease R [Dysgonamonadaceae bacterium]|jgi:ribonuclease R|nr:ribonuclease R [Dysgonamonadaceae bacterium]
MPKKKYNKPDRKLDKKEIVNRIINLFSSRPRETLNYKQVSAAIGATSQSDRQLVANIFNGLVNSEYLLEVERGRYKLHRGENIAEGRFERRANGRNSFLPDDGSPVLFVSERNTLHALNGDKVKVNVLAKQRGKKQEAEVIEIIENCGNNFVGIIEVGRHQSILITDSKTLAQDIIIPKDKLGGATDGQKVVVRITQWPMRASSPEGEVIEVLGEAGENDTEMHAILAEFGLSCKYPENVEKAASKISAKITKEEISKREDFRQVPTFTIDPADAKDYDDAISIRHSENGWEVGIHIADVTHYVKQGSIIDKEAYERATSVYLVDRTVPMLPESLSNNLCSLRPNENKLCFSVIIDITDNAEIKDYRIARTIINSNRRFSYEEAQQIIETGKGIMNNEIITLDRIAKRLREQRFKAGAISFERPEVKFDLDENSKPIRAYFKEAKDSNKLIEEFMLLANRLVAETIGKTGQSKSPRTFVYRIHDLPNAEKLTGLSELVHRLGYRLKDKGSRMEISKGINNLLNKVQGKREQNLIETVTIRSMSKAAYSTNNIGHYGLAFKYYTHFTSPIRRYPDMMVHRLLERYLSGGKSVEERQTENQCNHCSSMETLAMNAERTSIKYKQVEFMANKVGMEFDGVISGVTEWGLYVEIPENACEGMIAIHNLDDDYYEFDEKNYCLIGNRRKRRYSLGDPLKVKVVKANIDKRQLDFTTAG